ncbi:MAG: hypothetical protein K6A69_01155 [Lachnospiraceae bacterium]|nr:hypothetical protein [Lachnospiraceae bacterium]
MSDLLKEQQKGSAKQDQILINSQEFLHKRPELVDEADINAYEAREYANIESFGQEFEKRYFLIHDEQQKKVSTQVVTIPDRTQELAPIQEPQLGFKDRQRKERALKRSKDAKKNNPGYATDYTGYILETEKEYQKSLATNPAPDYSLAEEKQALKDEIFQTKYNPEVFKKDYFGSHYEQVSAEMRKLNDFIRIFSQGSRAYNSLPDSEKARVRVIEQTYALMNDCYEKALEANGVQAGHMAPLHSSMILPGTDAELEAAIANTSEHIKKSDNKVTDELKRQMEQDFQEILAEDTSEQPAFYDLMKREHPLVPGEYFSELTYADIEKYITGLDLEKNKERVEENRELIDKYLSEFIKGNQLLCQYQIRSRSLTGLQDAIRDKYGQQRELYSADTNVYVNLVDNEVSTQYLHQNRVSRHMEFLKGILDHLIFGKTEMDMPSKILLARSGHKPQVDEVESMEKTATYYNDHYREKRDIYEAALRRKYPTDEEKINTLLNGDPGRAAMMMRPGDDAYNDQVVEMQARRVEISTIQSKLYEMKGTEAETIMSLSREFIEKKRENVEAVKREMTPWVQRVLDFKMPDPDELTPEEIIAMAPMLHELSMMGMMMTDIGKDDSDEPGTMIKEVILGKPPLSLKETSPDDYDYQMERFMVREAAFAAKAHMIDELMRISRDLAILTMEAGELQDPLSALTETERIKYEGRYGDVTDAEFIILFAKENLAAQKKELRAAENKLIGSEVLPGWYLGDDARKTKARKYSSGSWENRHEEAGIIEKVKKIVTDTRKSPAELYREAKEKDDKQAMFELEVYKKLNTDGFGITGSDPIMTEAMFRSFHSSEATIGGMDAEKYHEMLANLSAGAFLDETATEEEINAAKEKNKTGLRIYYDEIEKYYEGLEEKYGYIIPDTAWIVEHYEEIQKDFANIQVDTLLIDKEREVLREDDPRDLRLINLVSYMNSLSMVLQSPQAFIGQQIFGNTKEELATFPVRMEAMQKLENPRAFLRSHPKGEAA